MGRWKEVKTIIETEMEMENPSMEWKPENNNNGQNFVSIRGENKFSQWEKEEKKNEKINETPSIPFVAKGEMKKLQLSFKWKLSRYLSD